MPQGVLATAVQTARDLPEAECPQPADADTPESLAAQLMDEIEQREIATCASPTLIRNYPSSVGARLVFEVEKPPRNRGETVEALLAALHDGRVLSSLRMTHVLRQSMGPVERV
jgi:hypothetical protein